MDVVFIDLCYEGQVSEEQSRLLSEIEPGLRDEYTILIGRLVDLNHVSGPVWLVPTTSRNPFSSTIFDTLLRLSLLETYLKRGYRRFNLSVDSPFLKTATVSMLNQYSAVGQIQVKAKRRESGVFLRISQTLYGAINSMLWPRLIRGKETPSKPITLLEESINARTLRNHGRFTNQYFPNLLESLDDKTIGHQVFFLVLFVSELRSLKEYHTFWTTIRKDSNRLLIRDDWLHLSDFLWAFWYSIVVPLQIKRGPDWHGLDLSDVIVADARRSIASRGLFECLLSYRVFLRFRNAGFKLKGVIEWNENQVIDRALCMGVKRFFPGVLIKGYQGFFVPEYYASHEITSLEFDADTTPDQILVVSKLLVKQKRKYCPNLKVDTGPALRFNQAAGTTDRKFNDPSFILAGLPIFKNESRQILMYCSELPGDLKSRLVIRPHPHMRKVDLDQIMEGINLPQELFLCHSGGIVVDGKHITLLISSGSSLCAEAVSAGIKVAIIGNLNGPTMNPLVDRIPATWWKICYSVRDIMDLYYSEPQLTDEDLNIFEPVTSVAAERMLHFDYACSQS